MSHKNPYQPVDAEVIDIIDESPTIKSFVLKPKSPVPFETGQFV
jgi:ferredoxin-NADP reductase